MLGLLRRIYFFLFRPAFTVRIQDGGAGLVQGDLPRKCLDAFGDIARDNGLSKGMIYGVPEGSRTRLVFSPDLDRSNAQRFMNAWAAK